MFQYLHKYFTAALIIYVLFLALKPCNDVHTLEFCQTEGIVHVEEQHTDVHHDLCSPLCNCLCCNTLVSISANHFSVLHNSSIDLELIDHPNIYPLSYKPTSPPPKA
ncbi:MAG TPA: hypothetical protein VG961_05695 [Ignavibacteria bacterium]|nr:hypothetical protein [Ignavibacteria bacterium]